MPIIQWLVSLIRRLWSLILRLLPKKRKSLTLIFDLDSVLNQLHYAWIELVRLRTGDIIRYEDCQSWTYPLGQKKYLELLSREPGFFQTVPEAPGAVLALNQLHIMGYEIIVCTASHPATIADKQEWLLSRFPWLSYKNIIYATRKELLAREDRLLIDDGPHNYDAWVAEGGHAVFFDHPWNRNDDAGNPRNAPRIRDFNELMGYIMKLETQRGL